MGPDQVSEIIFLKQGEKEGKLASLICILIERYEKYKVDSKRKTAVCSLRKQSRREKAGATEDSMGLHFNGKISR